MAYSWEDIAPLRMDNVVMDDGSAMVVLLMARESEMGVWREKRD